MGIFAVCLGRVKGGVKKGSWRGSVLVGQFVMVLLSVLSLSGVFYCLETPVAVYRYLL